MNLVDTKIFDEYLVVVKRVMLKQQDVFKVGAYGKYQKFRIPTIITTKKGSILITVEARYGKGGDWDSSDILMRKSVDNGSAFGDPVRLLSHVDFGNGPVNNFVMIPHRNSDRISAVFSPGYAKIYSMYSDDDGDTFSSPVDITPVIENFRDDYPWKVCATGPGHSVQLESGRIIVPVWFSDGKGKEFGSGRLGHRPSVLSVIYSDDFGENWEMGEVICRDGDLLYGIRITNPSETVAVQVNDSSVMFNIRTESSPNRRLIARSEDGVSDFRMEGFHESLVEPVCMGSLLRCSNADEVGGDYLLFVNPDTLDKTDQGRRVSEPVAGSFRDRKRLTLKVSEDQGNTWPFTKLIEKGPTGYSDLTQSGDGSIFCIYEYGSENESCESLSVRLSQLDIKCSLKT